MSDNCVISFLILKVLTPLALTLCVYVKQNVVTSVYWLLLFASPFISYTSKSTKNKKMTQEEFVENIGFINLNKIQKWYEIFVYLFPETFMLIWSALIILIRGVNLPMKSPFKIEKKTLVIGKFVVLVMLCLTGTFCPCWSELIYFATFILFSTIISFGRTIDRCFGHLCQFLAIVVMVHCLVIFFYQTRWIQSLIPPETVIASHLQLPMLVVLYHILAYQGIVTFFTALKRQKKDQFEEVPPEENESKSLDLGKFNIRSLINFLFPRPQYYFKTLYLATNAAMMYVYCMDYTDEELAPDENEIGLNKQRNNSLPIFVKSVFTSIFWINLYISISFQRSSDVDVNETVKLPFFKTREFIRRILSRIWFALIIILLFLIALTGSFMYISRIVYMTFALVFCALMQNHISDSFCLRLRYILCVLLIVCSMLMLTLVYTYHFNTIAKFWDLLIPENVIRMIGLESLKADMFMAIAKLTLVVIVISIYVNLFHKSTVVSSVKFSVFATIMESDNLDEEDSNETSEDQKQMKNIIHRIHAVFRCVDQYLNIHKLDFIWITTVLCILQSTPSIPRLMCLILSIIGLCLPSKAQIFIIRCISMILSGLILFFMIYQVSSQNQTEDVYAARFFRQFELVPKEAWLVFGIFKTSNIFDELIDYVLIICVITLFENLNRLQHSYSLFSDVTYFDTDDTIVSCLKYLMNYGFYRFSLEVCFIAMTISTVHRPGFLSLIMLLWLTCFVFMSRSKVNKIWKIFIMYMIIVIPIQYLAIVNTIPLKISLMQSITPWIIPRDNLTTLLFRPATGYIFYDFMVLFLSMKHLSIVKLESKLKQQNKTFAGGSNEQIEDFTNSTNPTRNYYQYMYSSVDVIKTYLFGTSFWVTLTCVFAIYKSQPYMFSLGYLTSVFLLLWLGNEFYLKSPKQILKYMNALIFYTLFVILVKIVLLVSHSEKINLRQLCYYFEFFVPITIQKESRYDLECQIDANNIDLFWDAICFSIFLFQKRIFRSYYFLHVVTKTKYMVLEASRGQKKIAEIEQENYKIYQAKNMKNYLRVRRRVKEMDSNLQLQGRAPRYHHEALRSGDYYMFSHIDKFINSNKTPKSNKISPKGHETSPKGQETSPKDQETSPKDQETSPKDQETSPKDQETSPKDQETSAEGETKEYRTRSAKYWHYTVSLFEKLTIALIKWFDDKSKSYYSTRETINKEKQEYYRKTVEINEDNTNETKPEENFIEITFVENNNIFRTEKMAKPSLKQEKVMSKETNLLLQLYFSVYHSIISNTTIIMYAVIIVHQATTASLLNLPISLFLFLWGSLSVPRPSVSFWIFLITYVEIMIVIKFVFSFETIKWNIFETDDVFFPPKFVGVSKSERISFMDICLLLVLFHHRHVLKSWGLWAQASFPESTKSTEKLIVTESMSAIKNVWLCLKKYMQPITEFLVSVFKEKRETINKDVYLYMFICDFFIFAILFAKFDSFVPPDEATDVSEYFQIKQSRKFTLTYVLFLISQFFLILADRVLYLRKFLKGKIVFDMVQIIGFHVLIFFVHPIYTNRYFKESLFPQLTFIIKSTYFAISSYIIRFGYPKKMVGNILQKDNVGLLHKYIYQLYMLIPFLHEMRTIMDWIWTDTSLTLGEWFRHEDIYTKLYLIRCDAQADDASPYPKGVKYPLSRKYLFGFLILSLIILCIWFPILLFTDYGFESGAQPDLPVEFKLTVRLEAYPPMYIQIVHKTQLVPISDEAYGLLLHQYTSSTEARRLLKAFNHKLVFAAPFDPQSSWQISPEQATNLEKQLKCTNNSTDPPNCQVKMTVTVDMQKEKDTVTATHSVQLLNETKTALSKALFENTGNNTITIKNVFPKFVKSSSEHVFLSQLMSFDSKVSNQHFFDVNMTLKFSPDGKSLKNATTAWTTIHSDYSNMSQKTVIEKIPYLTSKDPEYILIFNLEDATLSGGGIINTAMSMLRTKGVLWIYSTYVVFLSLRVMRKILTKNVELIICEELPYVNRVWELCNHIYMAREMKDLILEEDLYARLLFLFRSPETLITMTRPPMRTRTI
ncbi:hypothetical protein M8J77_000700 [Diaphorina citri]|nr:hypothetical protein M8J77_000700 [Diaphorina citri]